MIMAYIHIKYTRKTNLNPRCTQNSIYCTFNSNKNIPDCLMYTWKIIYHRKLTQLVLKQKIKLLKDITKHNLSRIHGILQAASINNCKSVFLGSCAPEEIEILQRNIINLLLHIFHFAFTKISAFFPKMKCIECFCFVNGRT